MTESLPTDVETEVPPTPEREPAPSTGHAGVDAVVASLDGLDDAPVADHVAVFEQAHARLRQTLTGSGDGVPGRG